MAKWLLIALLALPLAELALFIAVAGIDRLFVGGGADGGKFARRRHAAATCRRRPHRPRAHRRRPGSFSALRPTAPARSLYWPGFCCLFRALSPTSWVFAALPALRRALGTMFRVGARPRAPTASSICRRSNGIGCPTPRCTDRRGDEREGKFGARSLFLQDPMLANRRL